MDELNLEEVAKEETIVPRDEHITSLAKLVVKQTGLEDWILDVETKLNNAKAKLRDISEKQIPELMSQLSVSEFRLANGFKIGVKPWFNMNITNENTKEAYDWFEKNGHGSIVKHGVTIATRLTNEKQLEEIKALAEKLQLDVSEKIGIHHMTASAWAKDQITSGNKIPRELLGITQGFKTKITRGI